MTSSSAQPPRTGRWTPNSRLPPGSLLRPGPKSVTTRHRQLTATASTLSADRYPQDQQLRPPSAQGPARCVHDSAGRGPDAPPEALAASPWDCEVARVLAAPADRVVGASRALHNGESARPHIPWVVGSSPTRPNQGSTEPGNTRQSRKLLQSGVSEQVGRRDAGGVGPYQLDDGGAGQLRGDRRIELPEIVVEALVLAGSVGADRRPADGRLGGELGQDGGEGDAQSGALRLLLCVRRDEALRGLP